MFFRVLLVSILMLGQVRSIAQIEKLKSIKEVTKFVKKVMPGWGIIGPESAIRFITKNASDSLIRAYHIQTFEKADLDGNGRTDLIFNGSISWSKTNRSRTPISLAILSFGNDSFIVRNLSLEGYEDIFARSIVLDGKSYLQTIRVPFLRSDTGQLIEYHIDTLVCKFTAFIENRPFVKRKIRRLDYSIGNGLAVWGNMDLRIVGDSVRLKKQKWEGRGGVDGGGVFWAKLDPNTSQKLYGLLDAIDFFRLKTDYSIDANDASGAICNITYDDGQTKLIKDYGVCGTYGLKELHSLLYTLGETQTWVNADPKPQRNIDSLHTDREVLGLVRTLYDDYPYLEFEPDTPVDAVSDYRERLIAFGQQKWQKGDIDGNGYTDLLFNGYLSYNGEALQYSIVVLSFGHDSLLQQRISGANGFFAAKIIRNNGHDNVQINYLQAIEDSSQKKGYRLVAHEDTLTASEGHIIEAAAPVLHHIEALTIGNNDRKDSLVITPGTFYWYRNDAPLPEGKEIPKDSINLYTLTDPVLSQKILSLVAGVRFERINPELMMPNKIMEYFGATWHIDYDGGKRSQFAYDGLIGSYRLRVIESYLWELKYHRNGWKLIPRQGSATTAL